LRSLCVAAAYTVLMATALLLLIFPAILLS